MRIVVMSDSHGRSDRVKKVIEEQQAADLFIFLGDGLRDFRESMKGVPKEEWRVCGNSDLGCDDEYTLISYVKDVKIFCTHGHQWSVKYGLEDLVEEAHRKEAKILLYGHTHQAHYTYHEDMHIMNPGSLGSPRFSMYPTYGVIDIQGKNIVCSILNLID